MTKIRFGFSTCPNDTFIFDALYNHKIDWQGLDFEFVLADVEELNGLALTGNIEVTKISYHSYGLVANNYILSNYGSALGKNNGPLLIAPQPFPLSELGEKIVAIPGKHTTANLLLSIGFPQVTKKKSLLFSDIEQAVLDGDVDAGLIIHESRFTYAAKGLQKIVDLGQWWETQWEMPLPLGGICISRRFGDTTIKTINNLIGESVDYAFRKPAETMDFVRRYAQEMNPEVMKKHIDLYVNEYTRNIGDTGKKSVEFLFRKAAEMNIFEPVNKSLFVK
ncbi:MAG: 1,4-dihydroxy-6-naphthoate synthase [Bacteroidales bacterium]|nr:1,4-dihydroxy-6-naphthoate synthase [Bacteroidales bacterium]